MVGYAYDDNLYAVVFQVLVITAEYACSQCSYCLQGYQLTALTCAKIVCVDVQFTSFPPMTDIISNTTSNTNSNMTVNTTVNTT